MAVSFYRTELKVHYEHVGSETRYGWLLDSGLDTATVHPFASLGSQDQFVRSVGGALDAVRFDDDAERARDLVASGGVDGGESPPLDPERSAAYLALATWGGSEAERERGFYLVSDYAGSQGLFDLAEQWDLGEDREEPHEARYPREEAYCERSDVMTREMSDPRSLSRQDLEDIVAAVQERLYLDADDRGEIWSPDKKRDSETLSAVAEVLEGYGLVPKEVVRVEQAERAPERAAEGERASELWIAGKTFDLRGELKALGAQWDKEIGAWRVPAEARPAALELARGHEGLEVGEARPEPREKLVAIVGRGAYDAREEIKALGGRWDKEQKAWLVPESKKEAAEALAKERGFTALEANSAPELERPSEQRQVLLVTGERTKEAREELKALDRGGVQWDPGRNAWEVPMEKRAALERVASKYGLEVKEGTGHDRSTSRESRGPGRSEPAAREMVAQAFKDQQANRDVLRQAFTSPAPERLAPER